VISGHRLFGFDRGLSGRTRKAEPIQRSIDQFTPLPGPMLYRSRPARMQIPKVRGRVEEYNGGWIELETTHFTTRVQRLVLPGRSASGLELARGGAKPGRQPRRFHRCDYPFAHQDPRHGAPWLVFKDSIDSLIASENQFGLTYLGGNLD